MFVAIINAEMGSERIIDGNGNITNKPNTIAWKAVAYIIMNRLNKKMDHWANENSVKDIIEKSGFSGYGDNNYNYAMDYLDNRDFSNDKIEQIISVVLPIYLGDDKNDFTKGAVLYYSPESMIPPNSKPNWNFKELKEIDINGVPKTSLRVFDYINK